MITPALSSIAKGWLSLETADTPMHMGGLLYFRVPKTQSATAVATALYENWLEIPPTVAPWTLRLKRSWANRNQSAWQVDENLEMEYHLRHAALPRPGGERELGELISRLHGRPLDRSRPLWECYLIEGLHGNRFALYLKIHPALISGLDFLDGVLSGLSQRPTKQAQPPWTASIALQPKGALLRDWPHWVKPLWRHLRDAVSSSLPWAGLQHSPSSALNGRINGLRRFATQRYSRARLSALAKQFRVSDEDILYYAVGSALRRFFKEYNALPDEPLVAVVADRSRQDALLTPLLISLGTHLCNRRERLQEVRHSLRVARGMVQARPAAAANAEAAIEVMPYILRQLSRIDHRLPPMFNLGVVNYERPHQRSYLGKAQLEQVFPMPMLLQGSALAIASISDPDNIFVGLCGARDNLPHLQRIAVYMDRALEELEEEGLDDA